jgi:uncharacterized OB-fold protein
MEDGGLTDIPKPVPVPDRESEGFWSAAARQELAVQRCNYCGRLAHPPVVVCPGCLSPDPDFTFDTVRARATLRTWTIMRDAFLPGFKGDVPWVIAEAELDDAPGVRMIARLIDGPDSDLHSGAGVEFVFERISEEITLPVMQLVQP